METQVVGRRVTVEATFYLDADATEEQIMEWLEFEWGGGAIASGAHLADKFPEYLSITSITIDGRWKVTDWGDWEDTSDGRTRKGRHRFVAERPAA